jgi:hypothetical protein
MKISSALQGRVFGDHGQLGIVEYCMERFSSQEKLVSDKEEPSSWAPAEFETDSRHKAVAQHGDKTQDMVYDAESGYYWHTKDQVWGTKDPVTDTFVPYVEPDTTPNTSTIQHQTSTRIPSAVVVSAKPQMKAIQKNKPKPIQGIIHTGTWANKKKQKIVP